MCSRYEVEEEIVEIIDGEVVKITVRYKGEHKDHVERPNRREIRPTNTAPIFLGSHGDLIPATANWGWKLPWSKAPQFLARTETVSEKPLFKDGFQSRRCIVPASTWIEYQDVGHKRWKRPWRFRLPSGPFAFAGLWEGVPGGELRHLVLTREAGPNTRDLHERIPVVLPQNRLGAWLRGEMSDPGAEAIIDGWDRKSDWPDERGPQTDPTPSLI